VKPAVLALVLEALLRIGRRALGHAAQVALAALSFAAIACFQVPFPWIVLAAGIVGLAGSKLAPEAFRPPPRPSPARRRRMRSSTEDARAHAALVSRALRVAASLPLDGSWLAPVAGLARQRATSSRRSPSSSASSPS
jgi:chromate transporter